MPGPCVVLTWSAGMAVRTGYLAGIATVFMWAALLCGAQDNATGPNARPPDQQARPAHDESQSTLTRIRDLPIVGLIGPYIPPQGPLIPLTFAQRRDVYFRQTYLNAGSYLARMFSAGIDQARSVPREWGGGMPGYGRRFGSRFGAFAIQNSISAGGNAALGYETRYDICRCTGFWPRTRHAIVRNFITYNDTENELRPQLPMYAAAYAAGMISATWWPTHRNPWAQGAYNSLSQAGIGSGVNWVSEFSMDILHALGIKKTKWEK